jgi:hypothetical protein
MIRITITAAAFEAIAATLPSSVGVEQNRAPDGDYFIWLDPRYVDRLRAMRGPGESYSDVILRLAEDGQLLGPDPLKCGLAGGRRGPEKAARALRAKDDARGR